MAARDPVAPVGVVLGRLDRAAPPGVADVVDARVAQRHVQRAREVERGVPGLRRRADPGTEPVDERAERVLAELVVARADGRTDGRVHRTGAELAHRGDAGFDHSAERAAPSHVHRRDRGVVGDRHRRTVGADRDERQVRDGRGAAVTVDRLRQRRVDQEDVGAVHVERPHPALGSRQAEHLRQGRAGWRRPRPGRRRRGRRGSASRTARRDTPPRRSVKTTRAQPRVSRSRARASISAGTRGRRSRRRRRPVRVDVVAGVGRQRPFLVEQAERRLLGADHARPRSGRSPPRSP